MINYFLKLKNFDKNFKIFVPISLILSVFFLFLAIFFIINSPDDYQQANAVKIMFIHVPSAWMSLLIYTAMAVFNISAFIWKNRFFYIISRSIAEVGCLFTAITLITGAIWGKPIWGAWWVWDARLTTVLILFFLYVGYLLIYENITQPTKAEKISAIIAIIGFVNIPLIKFSVEYWNSLHQKASILRKGGLAIHQDFLPPLFFSFGFYFFIAIFLSLMVIKNQLLIKAINSNKIKIK
jgi:heme exporter protein C